eukprot:309617_1
MGMVLTVLHLHCSIYGGTLMFIQMDKKNSKGSFELYLMLVMYPTKVSEIVFRRKLTNQESGRFTQANVSFSKKEGRKSTGWPDGRLKTNEIQKFNTLTFTVDLEMLGVP